MAEENKKQEDLLELMYDFVLNPNISTNERKIGLLAKTDLEKGRYQIAVLNQIVSSFQMLAVANKGLTPESGAFYKKIYAFLVKNKSFGTNIGYVGAQASYLD
ncbi:bacteriocin immunity protein [Companilactobacillus kimchiensis]|uniref:Gar-IM n=1 Tax=Companilactobacillus kimchiensis TaxID=993692 RepID=A0A0R2LIJ5_9LACO|nr:bacteriocin immunity protein [Companilactobacillus kimchiensis]KRN99404.1 hypothetical protein IV57_GL002527 [Companilactobacillus kimchiensis]